jgi:hypothetical protein
MTENNPEQNPDTLRQLLNMNSENTMDRFMLDSNEAQKIYSYLTERGGFFGRLDQIWEQVRENSNFANEHGYVQAQFNHQTQDGEFIITLSGMKDESPFKPYSNWSVKDVASEAQPEGLRYNLQLTFPNGYRSESLGKTKDDQIIVTGSKKVILLDNPDKLNEEVSMGHYTTPSLLVTLAKLDVISHLNQFVSGTLN